MRPCSLSSSGKDDSSCPPMNTGTTSFVEFRATAKKLKNNRASREDAIPAEFWKANIALHYTYAVD